MVGYVGTFGIYCIGSLPKVKNGVQSSVSILEEIAPSLRFSRDQEEAYKEFQKELPKHKRKYAKQNMMLLHLKSKDVYLQLKKSYYNIRLK